MQKRNFYDEILRIFYFGIIATIAFIVDFIFYFFLIKILSVFVSNVISSFIGITLDYFISTSKKIKHNCRIQKSNRSKLNDIISGDNRRKKLFQKIFMTRY